MSSNPFEQAAKLIAAADGLLITAGAGMGVDSGLPDFRGNEGFWKAYPALAASGVCFTSIANPKAFRNTPRQAWGFYGHRLALYRKTLPHDGFRILKDIGDRMSDGVFVVTSNVDGQFQKAGFSQTNILEIHGSIHRLQCITPCRETVWSADLVEPTIDDELCEWVGKDFPTCDKCGKIARPEILMFNDDGWIGSRSEIQRMSLQVWSGHASNPVVIELGAGVDIPSIRRMSEQQGCPVIRINPQHPQLREGLGVSLPMGAKEALSAIEIELRKQGFFDSRLEKPQSI